MNGRFFRFDTWAVSDRGCVRDINEDQYLVEPSLGVWVVADGMGGHDAGEVASSAIVEHLGTIGIASSAPDLRARFEDRLARANREIQKISRSRNGAVSARRSRRFAYDRSSLALFRRQRSIGQAGRDRAIVARPHGGAGMQTMASYQRKRGPGRAHVITRRSRPPEIMIGHRAGGQIEGATSSSVQRRADRACLVGRDAGRARRQRAARRLREAAATDPVAGRHGQCHHNRGSLP